MNTKSTKSTRGAHTNLRRNAVAQACVTFAMVLAAGSATAGGGWGERGDPVLNSSGQPKLDAAGNPTPVRLRTYYAHTQSGERFNSVTDNSGNVVAASGASTGAALRKFVDTLPGVGRKVDSSNNTYIGATLGGAEKYIPQAVASWWTKPDGTTSSTDQYYEIAVVQYSEKLHSDLIKPTLLRGYVQIDHIATNSLTGTLAGSKAVMLNANGEETTSEASALKVRKTDASGLIQKDSAGKDVMVAAKFVDLPHYLGPAIVATKGTPTRVKFVNLLPVGKAETSGGVVTARNGDLFLPVDETLPGAGYGPDGTHLYRQNRALIHLHGGDNPWISDGTPHQWITPVGEDDKTNAKSLASEITDAAALSGYLKGASTQNVPDMNDPGQGANTYYFPNGQTGRLEWYHDHSFGLTRLNVYAGMAAPYVLSEPGADVLLSGTGTAATPTGIPGESEIINMVIQDKTFVPGDIALQDARWNNLKDETTASPLWGQPGDLWYPHVYELNQNPDNSVDGTNTVGRWDWGPYFWPVFPALYDLPSGAVNDVTLTPEAWMDTPVVNGVAYPKLDVEPKVYRFRILNAANDRMLNLSMFVADTQVSTVTVTPLAGGNYVGAVSAQVTIASAVTGSTATPATGEAQIDPVTGAITKVRILNGGSGFTEGEPTTVTFTAFDASGAAVTATQVATATATLATTEVKMVPAVPQVASGLAACATDPATGAEILPTGPANACWPSTWPTDGRDGGVPDPAMAGPAFYQIGNEGGLLPKVAKIDPTPMGYEYNRRSVTVLNTMTTGLFMGNAERADVLIDFSAYAGKKIVLYSDAPAPVPAFDPRNDHYTGKADEVNAGSVETPQPGFGPNTRTVMRFDVAAATTTTPAVAGPDTIANAQTTLPIVYAATQEKPIVGQGYYNDALGTTWSDATSAINGTRAYAGIFTGTLQEPTFNYQPGSGGGLSVSLATDVGAHTGGLGYQTAPAVTYGDATLDSTLRVGAFEVTNPGSGYTVAPRVTITTAVGQPGSGAAGEATLKLTGITMTTNGSGYSTAPAITFSAPTNPPLMRNGLPTGSALPVAEAVIKNGRVDSITIISGGKGYASSPTITIAPPTASNGVQAKATTESGVAEVSVVVSNPSKPNQAGGGGYKNMADVTIGFTAPQLTGGTAAVASAIGSVFDIQVINPGSGIVPPTGTTPPVAPIIAVPNHSNPAFNLQAQAAAAATGSMVVKNKAIQELFDPTYGRMNATLGVELPFTSALVQTTIPLGYVDPATELLKNGETQIWKITHNGVDAHPIHFHLFNVQLVNRIGWDGTVKVPADNERGWKETIRFNPLEDLVVALRPKTPTLGGFGLPTSSRPMDPSQPLGVPTGFTQVDTVTGNPATVVNDTVNYGWEYVWHCHILGHEENDFMRPVVFDAAEATPPAPTMAVPAPTYSATNGVALSWADNATTEYKYTVTRSPVAFPNQPDGTTTVSLLANATGYTDTTIDLTKGASSYTYTVTAVGANMDPKIQSSASTTVTMPVPPTAPSSASISSNSVQGTAQAATATLTFRDRSNNETSFVIQSSTGTINNSTVWTSSAPIISTTSASTFQTISTTVSLTTGVVNNFRVVAVNAAGLSVPSNTATVDMSVPTTAGTVNTAVQGTVGNYRNLVLNWSSPTNGTNPNGTTYAVVANGNQLNGNLRNGINTFNNFFPATGVTNYTIQVVATRTVGAVDLTATSNTVSYTPTIYGASVNGVSTVTSAPGSRTITVNWTATPATNGATTRYDVQRATSLNNNANWTTISGNGVNGLTFNATGLTSGTTYYFRVRANSGNPLNSTSPYVTTSAGTKAP